MATLKELLGEAYKDGMTYEEIETALNGKKLADLSSGEYVAKGKATEYERRAREAEQKLQERLTDDEKREQDQKQREEYYKALERKVNLSEHKARLAKSIDDENTLNEIAELFADGKITEALDKQNEYFVKNRVELEKQIKADLMKQNPPPTPQGNGVTPMTKDEIMAIKDSTERQEAIANNPQLFGF